MLQNNPNLNLTKIDVYTKFCQFVFKILSGNKILTSIMGFNSVMNVRKITVTNHNLDLVNMNVYTKFGQILSFPSQNVERK